MQYRKGFHIHHITPKHMGGLNNEENLIYLTVKEHAEWHYELWCYYGYWQDYVAWKSLSGQIDLDEIRRLKASLANKGKKQSDKTKKLRSEQEIGKHKGVLNHFYGKTHSEETRKIIKEKRAKQVITEETKQKMSDAHKKRYKENPLLIENLRVKFKGSNNHFFGKHHSDVTKDKMRNAKLKKRS